MSSSRETSQIQKRINEQLARIMLDTPVGHTREATAAAVLKHMQPFLKKPSKHQLSAMMVQALFKFREAVQHYGRNSIHIRKEMFDVKGDCPFRLTYDQLNNWSKLRFFGLSVHEQKNGAGYWLMTDRAGAFLRGEISIVRTVWTYNGHPVHLENESSLAVHIRQYKNELPDFETWFDFHPASSKPVNQLTLA